MREITVKVFQFKELDKKAKEKALTNYQISEGYHWADDALASIKALAVRFGGKLEDWSIDWMNPHQSRLSFNMPDMTAAEIRRRMRELGSYNQRTGRGHGSCVLTGYSADEDAIDGFRLAWRKGVRGLTALMYSAGAEWLNACCADAEEQYTESAYADFCEANDIEFFENGAIVGPIFK